MKHITPIIHMTNECNMACRYCYTGSGSGKSPSIADLNDRFGQCLATLDSFIDQVVSYNSSRHTRLIFHGGEPLLINVQNWESMLTHLSKKNYPFTFSVQTNGTLLDENFVKLFKQFHVELGISLDGPKLLNDTNRILKSGEGTFTLVFENLLKLRDSGLSFGILLTLTKKNVTHLEEVYTFFKKHRMSFTLRPVFTTKHTMPMDLLISPREYSRAICRLFDLWFDDHNIDTFLIEEFASMIAQFIRPIEGLVSCNFTRNCSEHFVCVDLNGDLYPCNRFYGDVDFVYGNILDDKLVNVLGRISRPLSTRWRKLSISGCQKCEISRYCFGGCPGNAYYFNGDYFNKDFYCPAYKKILRHVYERVQSTLECPLD